MPNQVGNVQNTGTLAHYMMLDVIKTFAQANGYTILRYNTGIANRELIMQAPGLSGSDQIFMGFRCYQDSTNDYYNMTAMVCTGYVSSSTFDTQPGVVMCGIPAHNNRIDYWLSLNGQRIILAMKVGTPVYESAYVGKFLPYATPSQYPYPVVCAGMLSGEATTRFSDTTQSIPYKGNRNQMRMRFNDGVWKTPECWPWNQTYSYGYSGSNYNLKDTNNSYPMFPVVLGDSTSGVYGELDGIFYISGFNNVTENTLVIGGVTYVVIQDVYRTGFKDYYAMRLDP